VVIFTSTLSFHSLEAVNLPSIVTGFTSGGQTIVETAVCCAGTFGQNPSEQDIRKHSRKTILAICIAVLLFEKSI
jgi:hypothetical protein